MFPAVTLICSAALIVAVSTDTNKESLVMLFSLSTKAMLAAAVASACLGNLAIAGDEKSASDEKHQRVETVVKDGVIKIRINDGKEISIPLPEAAKEALSSDGKTQVDKEIRVITLNSKDDSGDHSDSADPNNKKMRIVVKGKAIVVGDDGNTAVVELDPENLEGLSGLHEHLAKGAHSFSWTSGGDDHTMAIVGGGKYMIGVHPEEVSDVLRAHLPIQEDVGLVVVDVVDGSPAAEAGIEKQDILLKVNNADVKGIATLIEQVQKSGESKEAAKVVVLRRGKEVSMDVTPKERETGGEMELKMKVLERLGNAGDGKDLAKKLAALAQEKASAAAAEGQAVAEHAHVEALSAQVEALKAEIDALRKELKK